MNGTGHDVPDDARRLHAALAVLADDGPPAAVDLPRLYAAARRRRTTSAVAQGLAVVLVVLAAGVATSWFRSGTGDAGPAQRPAAPLLRTLPADRAALVLGAGAPSSAIARPQDPVAVDPPPGWSLIVRAADGSFGRHGAVVTYPVPPGVWGTGLDDFRLAPGVVGHPVIGGLTWADHADAPYLTLIRGDLPRAALAAIARSVRIVDGRPVADHLPAGVHAVATTPWLPPVVDETRYDPAALGVTGLGESPVVTELALSGNAEDAIYYQRGYAAPTVTDVTVTTGTNGRVPAVLTNLVGNGADLMWEVSPGVAARISWDGAPRDAALDARLVALAARARLLPADRWDALRPQEIPGDNGHP